MEIFLIRTLQFLLSISLLVLLHEGGHFFFAKLFKVRVSRFYMFFHPKFHIVSTYDTWVRRLLRLKPEKVPVKDDGSKEYVGTEYGIGWLPLGGYCAIDGMIDETNQKLSETTHPWEFRTKPVWQRLLIMVGGVLVNFLLALFIYSMVLFTWGDQYFKVSDMTMGMKFNEAAKELGFRDHDVLLGTDQGDFKDFSADLFRDLAVAKEARVLRDGQVVDIALPGDLNLLDMLKSEPTFCRPFVPAVIDSVMAGSEAARLGLAAGDTLKAIGGKEVDSWNEFTYQVGVLSDILAATKTHADSLQVRTTQIVVARAARPLEVVPVAAVPATDSSLVVSVARYDTLDVVLDEQLRLGVIQRSIFDYYEPTKVEYGFWESFPAGVGYGINVLRGYVGDLKYLFSADGAKSLGGFGAIGSLFPPMWDWHTFWLMTAFLSIILAFMNILPIPALDGGHILFLMYEAITGRKPSDKFMVVAEYVGFGLVILLMVVANLNDLLRWLGYM